MALKQIIVGIILTLLFGFLLFEFLVNFVTLNNPTSPILSHSTINQSMARFNYTLTLFQTKVNETSGLLAGDEPSALEYLFLIAKSMWSIPRAFLSILVGGFEVIRAFLASELLGNNANNVYGFIFNIVAVIVSIAIIFYIIRMIRSGDGG